MIEHQKYDYIIFDSNNYYLRQYMTRKDEVVKQGKRTVSVGGIRGFLQGLNKIAKEYLADNGQIICGFDNQASKMRLRKEIDPDYKANRVEAHPSFARSIEMLQTILLSYRDDLTVLMKSGQEFDDMALPLIAQLPEDKSVLIITNDMDFFRLLDYKGRTVHIYDNNKVWNQNEFESKYGFFATSETVVMYKVIRGDRSDNIAPGIPNFPKKSLEHLISVYPDIYEFIKEIEIFEGGKWRDSAPYLKGKLRLNAELIDFIESEDADINSYLYKAKFNPKVLAVMYGSLQFSKSFDRRVESYMQAKEAEKQGFSDSFFEQPKMERV